MRLCKPSFEIWNQPAGLEGIYKQIEKAAKICYKSEDNITKDSAKPFMDNVLLKRGHLSPLEHGTVYLWAPTEKYMNNQGGIDEFNPLSKYEENPFSVVCLDRNEKGKEGLYVTSNYRVLVEQGWLDDLKYLCEPTKYHAKRVTVRFVCDRGILAEFTRHRVFSFAAESTRYCNYSNKDKFGNEVTFIIPCWADSLALQEACKRTPITSDDFGNLIGEYYYHFNGKEATYFKPHEMTPEQNFIVSLQIAEQLYLELLNQGWKPQQARAVLPNALKTELVMTGFVSDWEHFFGLRTPANAHPQARELAIPLKEEFIKRGLIK